MDLTERYPGTQKAIARFTYDHLPPDLQALSKKFADLANEIISELPDDPDLTDGLRKLWESKNCIVYLAVRVKEEKT